MTRDEPLNTAGCQALWLAVLFENIRLAAGHASSAIRTSNVDTSRAANWIGSRDFREVCDLAGVDADYVLREIARLQSDGFKIRKVR